MIKIQKLTDSIKNVIATFDKFDKAQKRYYKAWWKVLHLELLLKATQKHLQRSKK